MVNSREYNSSSFTCNKVFVADASDLGLPPGHWPIYVTIDGENFYAPMHHYDPEGELSHVTYMSHTTGNSVKIFND